MRGFIGKAFQILRCNLWHRKAYCVQYKACTLILCKLCKTWIEIPNTKKPVPHKTWRYGYSERRE